MTDGRAAPVVVAVAVLGGLVAPVAAGGAPVGDGPAPLSADDGSGPAVAAQDGPRFVDAPYREHRGDVVRVPVAVGSDSATTVTLRGNDTGYAATVTLHDGNGDGRVTLLFNTYTAGADRSDATYRATVGGDDVTVRNESLVVGRLPAGTYDLAVAAGSNATPTDRATLELRAAGGPELSVLRAHNRHFGNLTSPGDVAALRRAGHLARAPRTYFGDDAASGLLLGDLVVLELRAPGLAGALAAAEGPNATARFGDLLGRDLRLRLREHPRTVGASQEQLVYRFGDFAGRRVVADPANDTYHVVLDPTAPVTVVEQRGAGFVNEHELDGYRVQLGTPPDSGLPAGVRENATATFQFVDPTADVESVVPRFGSDRTVTVTGSAVVEPGTALVVQVHDDGESFSEERRVTVGLDGEWAVTFDLSDVSVDERFEVLVRMGGHTEDRAACRLRRRAVVRFEGGERYVQGVEAVRVDVATTDGGFVTVRRESGGGVLGHSAYLPPGNHTAVRVPVNASLDGNVTLLAVAYRDDGDRRFENGTDERYRFGDPSDAATLVDVDGTPTPTATQMVWHTPEPTPTPPAGPIPGLGIVLAVVALLAASLLVPRRR